jgi:predicted transport protein
MEQVKSMYYAFYHIAPFFCFGMQPSGNNVLQCIAMEMPENGDTRGISEVGRQRFGAVEVQFQTVDDR